MLKTRGNLFYNHRHAGEILFLEAMTSQIENFFVEVDNLIKLQLRDNVQNQPEIKLKFKD